MTIRIVVVLPAPLPPTKPVSRPAATVKLMSSTARISPKVRRQVAAPRCRPSARGLVRRSPWSLMPPTLGRAGGARISRWVDPRRPPAG